MAQASTNEIKPGMKVEVEGSPYTIIINEFVKPGKGQAINRIKMKHLLSGRVLERTYKSGEKLDLADVSETQMRLLYKEADGYVFMDEKSFEQIVISNDSVGETGQWMIDDHLYEIIFYNGEPVNVEPPTFMEMKIIETSPGSRGDTASGRVLKPAVLESGAKVQVPIFIEQDEKIKVDTRTGEYVSRVN